MPEPRRIRLSRQRGWRRPEGAVVVARPSRWGNPFRVDRLGREVAVTLYRDMVFGSWSRSRLAHLTDEEYEVIDRDRQAWRRRLGGDPAELASAHLSGHDLACWCRIDQPCHADVLLELANG